MGVTRRVQQRKIRVSFATVTAVAIAFLLFASGTSAFGLHPTRRLGRGEVTGEGEGVGKVNIIPSESGDSTSERAAATQRRLNGPGSAPPKCIAKCGSCRPCQPVRVVIQPGVSTPLEYYPIAWRCKCANKLFMP